MQFIFGGVQQGYVSVKLPDVSSAQLNPYQGTRLKVWIKTTINLIFDQFFNDHQNSFFCSHVFLIIIEPLSQPFGVVEIMGERTRPRRIHYNLISLLLRDNIIARR